MTVRKTMSVAAVALTALLLSVATSMAAVVTTHLNVRSQPGTHGAVVDVLGRGEYVEVTQQHGGWCYVVHPGRDGWSSCRYLTDGGYAHRPDPVPPRRSPQIDFSIGGPNFSFSIESGPRRHAWRPFHYRQSRDCIWQWGQWYCPVY